MTGPGWLVCLMPNLAIGPLCLRALGLWKDPELPHPQGCGGGVARVPHGRFPGAVLGGHLGCPRDTGPCPSAPDGRARSRSGSLAPWPLCPAPENPSPLGRCKKSEVPVEKVYKTQREKLTWALDMVGEDFEF